MSTNDLCFYAEQTKISSHKILFLSVSFNVRRSCILLLQAVHVDGIRVRFLMKVSPSKLDKLSQYATTLTT